MQIERIRRNIFKYVMQSKVFYNIRGLHVIKTSGHFLIKIFGTSIIYFPVDLEWKSVGRYTRAGL